MSENLQIGVSREDGDKAVAIMRLQGSLDANTQGTLEDKAREDVDGGAEYLLIDMSGVDYLGSAGMRAIHAITTMLIKSREPIASCCESFQDAWIRLIYRYSRQC